jgi:hypothetical protein
MHACFVVTKNTVVVENLKYDKKGQCHTDANTEELIGSYDIASV